MRVPIILGFVLLLASGCARPIVEDAGTITVDGTTYAVQYVTFEEEYPTFGAETEFSPPDPYYQVVVNGQVYRCGASREDCADAVRRAVRDQGRDEDEDSRGGDGGGGGYDGDL